MKSRGSVNLVGIGPGGEDLMSLGALHAIKSAEEIWLSDLGPWNHERLFLRKYLLKKKVVNLSGYYSLSFIERPKIYRFEAGRMAHLASRGRKIVFLFSGSPLVWVRITSLLKATAEPRKFDLIITPSMSFLDVIWKESPFNCEEFQLRIGGIQNPEISPDIDCVVGQVADNGKTGAVQRTAFNGFYGAVKRIYPPRHPVYISGSHPVSAEPMNQMTSVAKLPSVLPKFDSTYYCVMLPRRSKK